MSAMNRNLELDWERGLFHHKPDHLLNNVHIVDL